MKYFRIHKDAVLRIIGFHTRKRISAPSENGRTVAAMAKYKVYYSGMAYVEADSADEALEKYDTDFIYDEQIPEDVEEVNEFAVALGV